MANETKETPKASGPVKFKFKGGKESVMLPGLGTYTNDHLSNPRVISMLKKRKLFDELVEVA